MSKRLPVSLFSIRESSFGSKSFQPCILGHNSNFVDIVSYFGEMDELAILHQTAPRGADALKEGRRASKTPQQWEV